MIQGFADSRKQRKIGETGGGTPPVCFMFCLFLCPVLCSVLYFALFFVIMLLCFMFCFLLYSLPFRCILAVRKIDVPEFDYYIVACRLALKMLGKRMIGFRR